MKAALCTILLVVLALPAFAGEPPVIEVIRGTAPAPDGLEIAYEVRSGGDPALVFIHCWSCDREVWRNQVDVFSGDHLVVTLDLP